MNTENGKIILEGVIGFSVSHYFVCYTDTSQINICIPMDVLIRLYEGAKFDVEKRQGKNWEVFCDSFFEKKQGVSIEDD